MDPGLLGGDAEYAAGGDRSQYWKPLAGCSSEAGAYRFYQGAVDHVEPLGMVVLGTAAKEKSPIDRYLEDQVFYETYQGEE